MSAPTQWVCLSEAVAWLLRPVGRRVRVLCLCVVAWGLAGCGDLREHPQPPRPRPPVVDLRICREGSSAPARNGGLFISIATHINLCPSYTLKEETDTVRWAAFFVVPERSLISVNNPPFGTLTITATYNRVTFVNEASRVFFRNPNDASQWGAEMSVTTQPGRFRNANPGQLWQTRDSAHAEIFGLRNEFVPAFGWVVRPGVIESIRPYIEGPTLVGIGEVHSWTAVTFGHPVTYQYEWFLDGTPLPSSTSETFSGVIPRGSHVLTSRVTRLSGISDEAHHSVYVHPCPTGQCNDY